MSNTTQNSDKELNFNEVYQEVKTSLARTSPIPVLNISIEYLHHTYYKGFNEKIFYVPWIPLALIEWSLVFGPKPTILLRQQITKSGYNRLYNLLHNSGMGFGKFLKSGQPFGLMKFFRCMAFQQFWFQGDKAQIRRHIGRNLLLFKNFNEEFSGLTGLNIIDFYEMLFVLFAHYNTEKNSKFLNKNLYRQLSKYNSEQIDLFFNLISLSLNELQDFMRNHHKNYEEKYDVQTLLSQMTPLWRYPLLNYNNAYICFYPALIEYALKYFVHEFLRLNQKDLFSRPFGAVMENHVQNGLKYLEEPFFNEDEIQKIAQKYRPKKQGKMKCVDFLVPQKNGILLIESKANEMPAEVKMNPDNEVLAKYFSPDDRHLFHGIIQAYELCDFIQKQNPSEFQNLIPNFYLILVTYKDYYLGKGNDFWNEFVKDIVTPTLEKKQISSDLINPQNIFVISLDEYDCLVSQTKENKAQITDILDFAIERDKDSSTMSFIFRQHIFNFNSKSRFHLPYLDEGYEMMTNNIIGTALKQGEA